MYQIQEHLLNFLDEDEYDFDKLVNFFEENQIRRDKHEIKFLFHMITKISNHHYRSAGFFPKIFQIIEFFKNEIKQKFTNLDIFNIFQSNKRILLYLFEEQLLLPDRSLCNAITEFRYLAKLYPEYFYPEFQSLYSRKIKEKIKNKHPEIFEIEPELFKQKRRIAENDNSICELIRNDSIDDFIIYVNKQNISLNSRIERSIFETNQFLLKYPFERPKLIEYAVFFGSIRIFKYLLLRGIELTSQLWLFGIHGQNAEIISILEDNYIDFEKTGNFNCLTEALKCHHNYIAIYLKDKFLSNNNKFNFMLICFKYYNFELFDNFNEIKYFNLKEIAKDENENTKKKQSFFALCIYDYYKIVSFLSSDVPQSFLENNSFFEIKGSIPLSINKIIYYAIKKGNTEIVKLLIRNHHIYVNSSTFILI